jgi:hypothetical protein
LIIPFSKELAKKNEVTNIAKTSIVKIKHTRSRPHKSSLNRTKVEKSYSTPATPYG